MVTFSNSTFMVLISMLFLLMADARPSDSSAPSVPLWQKYFRNDTLTGSIVPCTHDEKFCLERGLLLHKESGKCYLWGKIQPCPGTDEIFRVDKTEFLASGHVRGACVKRKLCTDPNELQMAADASCVYMAVVSEICYSVEGVAVSESWFGQTECACTYGKCPIPQQLKKHTTGLAEGQCVVTNLRDSGLPGHSLESHRLSSRDQVPCTEEEHRCFLSGRVYSQRHQLCHSLWERGPCEVGEWFALDKEEAVNGTGRLRGTCQLSPCAPGRVRSVATPLYPEGSCVTPRELCGGGYHVVYNAEGLAACSWSDPVSLMTLPTVRLEAGLCRFPGMHVGNVASGSRIRITVVG